MTQELTRGYIYHKQLASPDELGKFITQVSNSQSYYFLRYSHAVSGICRELPSGRGEIEGQVFNSICEIRWKKYKSGYEVIILSKQEFKLEEFERLTGNWTICDREAYWHDEKETKFPKGFRGQCEKSIQLEKIPIKQRYFKNSDTATIHFIALTVKQNDQHTET